MESIICRHIAPQYRPAPLRGHVGFMEDAPDWPDSNDVGEFEELFTQFYFTNRHAFQIGHSILRVLQRSPVAILSGGWPEGLFICQLGKGKTLTINAPA